MRYKWDVYLYISEQYAYFKFLMNDTYEMRESYAYPIT